MEQAVSAYRQITGSQEYQELERMRDKARHDEEYVNPPLIVAPHKQITDIEDKE